MSTEDDIRLLSQYFLTEKIVTEEDLLSKFQDLNLPAALAKLNEKLRFLSFEIKEGKSETTEEKYLCLCNTKEDETSQLAHSYSSSTMVYLKRVLRAIVDKVEGGQAGSLTLEEALVLKRPDVRAENSLRERLTQSPERGDTQNIQSQITDTKVRLTESEANQALGCFVSDKWLESIKGSGGECFVLAPRSQLELREYLESMFSERIECTVCQDVVYYGVSCQNCSQARMHTHCGRDWFANKTVRNCPACQNPWP